MRNVSKLKICFLAGTLEHGGAERQLYYMLQLLRESGAAPRVLSFDQGEFWEKRIRSLGVPVAWVGQNRGRFPRLLRIFKELRTDPPDLLQSQHFFANAYVGLLARCSRMTGIGALRTEETAEQARNGTVGGWLNLRLTRFIAANSRVAIQQAIARGISASRLHFLPNVVDTQRFRPRSGDAHRPLTLLSAARIVPEKRFDRFISAVGRLRQKCEVDLRAWIAGPAQDSCLRQELEAQASWLGLLPGRLQFLGAVSRMDPLYQQADICVLTSDFEGTPNVLMEAMASGLPVVATRVGGVPEIVSHGKTGFVVDRDDAEGLLAALQKLALNPELRLQMGQRAREYVETNHSLDRLPTFLDELYEWALPPRRPGSLGFIKEIPA